MRLAAFSLGDGRAFLVFRKVSGLLLELLPLTSRSSAALPTADAFPVGDAVRIVAVPSPITLPSDGAQTTLIAYGFDANGNRFTVSPTWSVVEVGRLTTVGSTTGLVTTGASAETLTIRATLGSLTSDVAVSVIEILELDSIEITPASWEMTTIDTVTFSATGVIGGDYISIEPTWSKVSGPGRIESDGTYFPEGSTGTAVIRATYGAVTADASITILPRG